MDIISKLPVQILVFIVGFIMAIISGVLVLPVLERLKFGQTVRREGPRSHYVKKGTPTMGGIIFLIPVSIICIAAAFEYPKILALLGVTLGFGAIGFIDDYIKVVKKRADGLYPKQKMMGLLVISVIFTIYAARYTDSGKHLIIPFRGVDSPILYSVVFFVPLSVIVLLATTNAVNLTDGLDGLAGGITMIVLIFFAIVAMMHSEWVYVKIFCSAFAGACLGFLAFNLHPAKVFMGDTGSLALGGALGAVAIVMQMPLILLIAGGIYVAETVSVIVQVAYFKRTGRRFFKMSPLHHHFELSGWKETKVVYFFWFITLILCLISFIALR